ncbi:MAG: GerMN domain-containing protein, partial [Microthrixaceae bacterium]
MNISRLPALLVVFGLAVTGLVACGGEDASNKTASSTTRAETSTSLTSTTAAGATSTTSPSSSSTTPQAKPVLRAYFVRDEKVGPVRRSGEPGAPARSAMDALLKGPTASDRAAGLSTAIPAGTKVLGLNIAGGLATIDLSSEFGSGGGSLSMQARVAQVVYTLTQFPTVQRVSFRMNGKAVTALGGEGLMINTPQTRAAWEEMTPAILLETPLPGEAVVSPFHIKGTANTFEATFMVSLTDSSGKKIYEHF